MPALENPQHEEFAHAYVALKDANAAARAAGIDDRGDNVLCYRGVPQRVRELHKPILRRYDITADRTMMGLARVGYADIRRLFDEEGGLLPVSQFDADTAGAIKGLKVKEEFETETSTDELTGEPVRKRIRVVTTEVKFNDRVPALGILAKHFKLVNDEGDGLNALANVLSDRLQSARKRRMVSVIDSTANPTPQGVEDARIIEPDVQAESVGEDLS